MSIICIKYHISWVWRLRLWRVLYSPLRDGGMLSIKIWFRCRDSRHHTLMDRFTAHIIKASVESWVGSQALVRMP